MFYAILAKGLLGFVAGVLTIADMDHTPIYGPLLPKATGPHFANKPYRLLGQLATCSFAVSELLQIRGGKGFCKYGACRASISGIALWIHT